MKKVVYLGEGASDMHVSLDGPALKIKRFHKAPMWIPLNNISYIVCNQHTQWKTDALLACMSAAILLVFNSSQGVVSGYCVGETRQSLDMPEYWTKYWEYDHQGHAFYVWHESRVRNSIVQMATHLRIPNPRLQHDAAMHDLEHKIYAQFPKEHIQYLQRQLKNLLHAWLVSELFSLNWPLDTLCSSAHRPDLSMCMVDNLHWEAQIIAIELLQRHNTSNIAREDIVTAFEQHKKHFKQQFSHYWHAFYHWLSQQKEAL